MLAAILDSDINHAILKIHRGGRDIQLYTYVWSYRAFQAG